MNNFVLIITEDAKSDISTILSYIAEKNQKAAYNAAKLFKKTFEIILEYPKCGAFKTGLKDKQILIYTMKKRYTIAYKVIDNKIIIFRVLTNYQDLFAVL